MPAMRHQGTKRGRAEVHAHLARIFAVCALSNLEAMAAMCRGPKRIRRRVDVAYVCRAGRTHLDRPSLCAHGVDPIAVRGCHRISRILNGGCLPNSASGHALNINGRYAPAGRDRLHGARTFVRYRDTDRSGRTRLVRGSAYTCGPESRTDEKTHMRVRVYVRVHA